MPNEPLPTNCDPTARAYLEKPVATTVMAGLSEGFLAPLVGLRYLWKRPALWRHAIIPILINIVISGLALLLFIGLAAGTITLVHSWFGEGWGWLILEILFGLVLLAMALFATFLTWLLLQAIFCGYFYDLLTREVEGQLGMRPEDIKDVALFQQVADTIIDLLVLLAGNIGLLLLNFLPLVGSVLAIVGGIYFNCKTFGAEYLSYPLAVRGLDRRQRRQFLRKFRSQSFGLGLIVLCVSLVPLVGPVILTTAVVGAVLLHRRLIRDPNCHSNIEK